MIDDKIRVGSKQLRKGASGRVLSYFSTSPTGSRNHLASFRFQNTFRLNV